MNRFITLFTLIFTVTFSTYSQPFEDNGLIYEVIGYGAGVRFKGSETVANVVVPSHATLRYNTIENGKEITISETYEVLDIELIIRDCIESITANHVSSIFHIYPSETLKSVSFPKVKEIPSSCFEDCKNLTNVNLPSLEVVPYHAFYGCNSLKNISLPNVITVDDFAFQGLSSLESVNLPNVEKIESKAFGECTSLREINFPKLTSLEYGFYSCSNLKSVNLPSLKELTGGFMNCTALTSICLPNVISISDDSFQGCTKLKFVSFPNVNVIAGSSIFENCYALKEIDCPKLETLAGFNVFKNCNSLETLYFPEVKAIASSPFISMKNIRSIILPKVERINSFGGNNCPKLEEVYIPNIKRLTGNLDADSSLKVLNLYNLESLRKSDTYEFDFHLYGNGLRKIIFTTPQPPSISSTSSFYGYFGQITLIVPTESEELYKNHPVWMGFYMIPRLEMKLFSGSGMNYGEWEEVKGVTADGASQIALLLHGTPSPDEKLHIKLTRDEATVEEAISGTVSGLTQFSDGRWGYIYTAPVGFPADCNSDSYNITATITTEGIEKPTATCDIEILRPGVILLHGLNSSSDCWRLFANKLYAYGLYKDFGTENVDYSSTNTASFNHNTHKAKVVEKAINSLSTRLLKNGIVSTKYDLVGHSMGGILSRLYVQEVDKSRVHKIITVNTPHFGSNWANFSEPAALLLPQIGLRIYFNNLAARDLKPSSAAMRNLSDGASNSAGIPIHAFGSYMTYQQTLRESDSYYVDTPIGAVKISDVISEDDPSLMESFIAYVLGSDKNDQVVTLESQLGGLSGGHITVLSDQVNAAHTSVTEWADANSELISLLKEPVTSDKFSIRGFGKLPVSRSLNSLNSSDAKEPAAGINGTDGIIRISSAEVSRDSLQYVTLHLDLSDNITRNAAFTFLDEERMIVGCDTTDYRFVIPEDVSGELKLYAVARTSDAKILTDSCTVEVAGDSRLAYIRFNDRSDILLMQGQTMSVNTESVWTDGEKRSLTPDLSTDNNEVLEIVTDGIYGLAPGECELYATYGEHSDSIHVKVVSRQFSSIDKPADYTHLTVRAMRGNIAITSGEDLPQGIEMELYTIDGTLVCRERKSAAITAGETVNFAIPESHRRAYVLRLVTHDRTEAYKLAF